MRARVWIVALALAVSSAACSTSAYGVKHDSWIPDCDTLTREMARLYVGMPKDELVRVLGNESWIISGQVGRDSVYQQVVVYNYNADCEKLRGRLPNQATRQLMLEFGNEVVARIIDRTLTPKSRWGR